MTLVYRAIKYQKLNSSSEVDNNNQVRTYRGVNWKRSPLSSSKTSQSIHRLKYRGIDYLV